MLYLGAYIVSADGGWSLTLLPRAGGLWGRLSFSVHPGLQRYKVAHQTTPYQSEIFMQVMLFDEHMSSKLQRRSNVRSAFHSYAECGWCPSRQAAS